MSYSPVPVCNPKIDGRGFRICRSCGKGTWVMKKYGLICCRKCFRVKAKLVGCTKLWYRDAYNTQT